MSFKQFLIDVINLNTAETIYRMMGFSEDSARFWALYDQNMQKSSLSLSPSERRAALERLEKSRAHYNETMAALAERRRKLYEDNPWLLEHDSEQPETLESICAASGDIDTYVAEKAKTDARYAAAQKEFQRIDASKAALEERRRKLYEENPDLYERVEKCREEVNRRREEAKPDPRWAEIQREDQRIAESKAVLAERRRKLYEKDPWLLDKYKNDKMTSVNETEGHKTPAAETLAAIADLENGGGERFSGETAELLRQLTEGEGND